MFSSGAGVQRAPRTAHGIAAVTETDREHLPSVMYVAEETADKMSAAIGDDRRVAHPLH